VRWSEAQRAEAAHWIARYKEIRPIVQAGDLYRLRSAQAHSYSALEYLSPDRSEGVLFAFRTHLPEPATLPVLRLQGLEPQARYELEGVAGARSGLAWMQAGVTLELKNFQSTLRRIRRAG
jgi:alpha-galactosidase